MDSKLRINIGAVVRPKLKNAKYATSASDGNQGYGGGKYSIFAEIYKEVKNLEFSVSAGKNIMMLSKSESASNSNETRESAEHQSTEFTFGLYGTVSETTILGGGLLFTSTDPYKSASLTNLVTTSTTNYDSSQASAIEILGKLKIEKASMLKLSFQAILDSSEVATTGANKLTTSLTGNYLSLEWVQEFN